MGLFHPLLGIHMVILFMRFDTNFTRLQAPWKREIWGLVDLGFVVIVAIFNSTFLSGAFGKGT